MDVLSLVIKIILCVFSIFLILIVLLQSGNKAGLSGTFGGSEAIVGKSKSRGMDALLGKLTKFVAIGFMILAVALVLIERLSI